MTSFLQQRANIFFCVKLGWNFTQIRTGLHAVYRQVLCDASIYKWIGQFKRGRVSIVDKPRRPRGKSGRSRINVRRVETAVANDRRLTIRELSLMTGIPSTSVQRILKHDLKLVKKCCSFVPHELTDVQRRRRLDICNFWTRLIAHTPRILRWVVTCDESWIYVYDPEMRQQSKVWLRQGEPRPLKARREMATAKVMIITFFDARGMIYFEYVQRPQTVNQAVFRGIFQRFHDAYQRRCPHAAVRGRHFIHLDNATPHTANLTLALIQRLGWTRFPQPPYSPDLAPSDFWLYARLKKNLRGVRFPSLAAVKEAVSEEISLIPSQEYQHCMLRSWPKRWRRCLAEQGGYFEGLPVPPELQ